VKMRHGRLGGAGEMRRSDYEVTTMRRSESREDDKGKGRDAVNAGKMIRGELLRFKVDILRRILIYTPQNVHFRSKQCGAHIAFCGAYSSMRQKNQRISVAHFCGAYVHMRHRISIQNLWRWARHNYH
jgi:hypothetical protein